MMPSDVSGLKHYDPSTIEVLRRALDDVLTDRRFSHQRSASALEIAEHLLAQAASGERENSLFRSPGRGDRPKCHQQPFLSLRGASWVWRFTPGGLFYRPKVLPLDLSMKLIACRVGRQQFDRPAAYPLQCCILKPGTSLLASAACGPVLPGDR